MSTVIADRKMAVHIPILYFSYPLDDDGAPHQAMTALWLARMGLSIRFIAWGNNGQPGWLADYPSITYQLLPKRGMFSAIRVLIVIFAEFVRVRPCFVYVQGAQQAPFLLWLPFFKGATKLIYHTQDYLGPGQHWFYETCERFFARHADRVISNEPNRARFMASSYRLRCMPEVIRTALPKWWQVPERDEHYRQSLLERAGLAGIDKARLIVAGGGYGPGRMSPEVVEALAQLPNNYALIFTGMVPGTSQSDTCKLHLKELGISRRVLLIERLGYFELLRLYTVCDIGILLYPNSGIGHFYQAPGRLTEYLRCGLQVVASNFPSLELLILKYQLGIVVDPYDAVSIADGIHSLGSQSNLEFTENRNRIKVVASSEMAYETQAVPVLGKIFELIGSETSTKKKSSP